MANFKALVVGIDDYPPPNQLPSCVNDATAMLTLLRPMGFEVTSLLNSQATTANVTEKLRELFKDVKPDDRLVFYYSGHGYTDRKANLMEEYLVLIDGLFSDDLLSELTQVVLPGTLTIILDSCFSGGMEKFVMLEEYGRTEIEVAKIKSWKPTEAESKSFNLDARPDAPKSKGAPTADKVRMRRFGLTEAASKQILFQTEATSTTAGGLGNSAGPLKGPGSDEVAQTQTKGLLIAACLETETAAASTSTTDGKSAFTYALLSAIQSLGIHQSTTAIFQKAASILKPSFRQTPLVIAPTSPPGLAGASFLKLEPVGGGVGGAGSGSSVAGIDSKLLIDVLVALIPALFDLRPKSILPFWPNQNPLFGPCAQLPQPLGPTKGDDPFRLLGALIQSLIQAASQRSS